MWYQAHLTAYDVMADIHIHCKVIGSDGRNSEVRDLVVISTDLEGTGETDPVEWLRDLLVATIEEL